MERSDWITIISMFGGVLLTTLGSAIHLSFKMGGVTEKVMLMEKTMENMTMRIPRMEVEIAEIKVKVDALWQSEMARGKQIRAGDRERN